MSRSTAEILQRYKEVLRRSQDLENAIRQHRREWTKAEIKHPRDVALWNTLGDEK